MILKEGAELKSSNRSQAKIATLPLFDMKTSKVEDFMMACKLYVRIRMRKTTED